MKLEAMDIIENIAVLLALSDLQEWVETKYADNPTDGYGAGLHTVLEEINRRIEELTKEP